MSRLYNEQGGASQLAKDESRVDRELKSKEGACEKTGCMVESRNAKNMDELG